MFFKKKSTKDKDDMFIKSTAYDALIEYGADSLPIPTPDPATGRLLIFPKQLFLEDITPVYFNLAKHDGVLMKVDDERYVIMYDQELIDSCQRWVIFKLLFYIKSGIADDHPKEYITCDCLPGAEQFAEHFACPDIILETCGILNAEDIIKYCKVPFWAASHKDKYFKINHEKFIFPSLEKMLKNNFKLFIANFQKK